MSRILRNTTGTSISFPSTGVTIGVASSYAIPQADLMLWADSDLLVTHVGSGAIVINDGDFDLSPSTGLDLIKIVWPRLMIVSNISGSSGGFIFGDVNTAVISRVPVRRSGYLEQTTNATRSVVSSSAADSAAGTGARTIVITYLDQTGAGPFTTTVTLNGTTAVNTSVSNICFVQNMRVNTVGSGGVNAGVISLRASTAGAGVTIGSFAASELQTFWAQYYVPLGKKLRITGLSVSHNGTVVGSGAVFSIWSRPIGVLDAVEFQVGDFHRLYGQDSTSLRSYGSPITVAGPARILTYVLPESSTALVFRASIDFYEE